MSDEVDFENVWSNEFEDAGNQDNQTPDNEEYIEPNDGQMFDAVDNDGLSDEFSAEDLEAQLSDFLDGTDGQTQEPFYGEEDVYEAEDTSSDEPMQEYAPVVRNFTPKKPAYVAPAYAVNKKADTAVTKPADKADALKTAANKKESAADSYRRSIIENVSKLYGQKPKIAAHKAFAVPQELQSYLDKNADAKKFFNLLHTGQKKDYCDYITEKDAFRDMRAKQVFLLLKNKQYTRFSKRR